MSACQDNALGALQVSSPATVESPMAGKNKGGREIRKPKQDKKPKGAAPVGLGEKAESPKRPS